MIRKVAGACLILLSLTAIGPLSMSQAAKFTAEPLELGFRNNLFVGEEETKTVKLKNTSGEELNVLSKSEVEPQIFKVVEVKSCLAKIPAGGFCEIKVTFKPDVEQKGFGGKYELNPEAVGGPWAVVKFSGGTMHPNSKAELASEADSKDLTLLTKEVGIKFAVTCTNLELVGLHLESEGKLNAEGKAKLTGCEAYGKGALEEPLGCHVHSSGKPTGTIETGKVKGELALHELAGDGKELLTKLEPETGPTGTFASVLTEGCVIPESNPVHGTLYLKDGEKTAETHLIKHLVEAGPLTSLWVGGDTKEHLETSIDGSFWAKLGGTLKGITWGAYYVGSLSTWVVLNGE